MELEESQSSDRRKLLREKTHTSMLVATIWEGEERGICSAALKQLLNIVKYQIEDRSVVVLVLNKESSIWKDASMKTLLRGYQLKVIDVEGMKVVTNNRCVAEQIKSDRVESVATGGIKSGEFRNVGFKIGKLGKICELQNGQIRTKRNCASQT